MSISYRLHVNMFDYEYTLELDSLDVSMIERKIEDYLYEDLNDILYSYDPAPCGDLSIIEEYGDAMYSVAKEYILAKKDTVQLYAYQIIGGEELGERIDVPLDIPAILCGMLEERSTSDQNGFDRLSIMITGFDKFVAQGMWQFGLKTSNGSVIHDVNEWPHPLIENGHPIWQDEKGIYRPIVWYGLPNEDPLDRWSLCVDAEYFEDEYKWQDFWYNDDDCELMGLDSYYRYYFFEGGSSVASLLPVLQSCPIALNEDDSNEILLRKVEQFVLQQSDTSMQTK